jgi:hypothetical protein
MKPGKPCEPSITYADGSKVWYEGGVLHRTDGPAVEWADEEIGTEYHVRGTKLTPAEFAAKFLDKDTALLWKMSGYCWPFNLGGTK